MEHKYKHLLNKEKSEILLILGQEFNFYPSNIWTYIIHQNWWGKKTILFVFFEEDKVVKIKINKRYGKI